MDKDANKFRTDLIEHIENIYSDRLRGIYDKAERYMIDYADEVAKLRKNNLTHKPNGSYPTALYEYLGTVKSEVVRITNERNSLVSYIEKNIS